jgi:hypothetical protein
MTICTFIFRVEKRKQPVRTPYTDTDTNDTDTYINRVLISESGHLCFFMFVSPSENLSRVIMFLGILLRDRIRKDRKFVKRSPIVEELSIRSYLISIPVLC